MVYSLRIALAALATLLLATLANGLTISYCSSQNTGSNFQASYSNFQSNGLCQTTCAAYAYAVLQGSECWCSNYAPASQVTTSDCNEGCPGYPYDWCGSQSAGLFGYYQLGVAPSGTAGQATSPASSSVSTTSSTSGPPSSSSTSSLSALSSASVVVATPVSSTHSSTSTTTTSVRPSTSSVHSNPTSTSQDASTSNPPSTTGRPTQVYTSVITVTGQVTTIVVTPTASSDPSSLGQGVSSSGGVSTGKVVGIVLGVALGLGLIIGLAVWLWLRRKHRNHSQASSQHGAYGPEDGNGNRTAPSRQVSQMSSSGLLGKAPRILTAGYGPANGNANSNGLNPRSPDTVSSNGVDRRSLGTDQRLNPYAIYAHEEARLSSVSLQDNQDYSRQLRIANPDE